MKTDSNKKLLSSIRKNEAASHIKMYSENDLFSDGWLGKPVKTVTELFPLFDDANEVKILDLGCGVGRNSIPAAQYFSDKGCLIDCVDILEKAVSKLNENAAKYSVAGSINGIVSAAENYVVKEDHYDMVIAVSVLEHLDSEKSFEKKLLEIRNGLKPGGVACIIMNTDITESEKATDTPLIPQFELNFKTDTALNMMRKVFNGFDVLKETVREQYYEVPRGNIISLLKSRVVTFAAKRTVKNDKQS